MLSPSSKAAVAFEVNYTLGLLERFPADGVYLDDNQLGGNASDPGVTRPRGWRACSPWPSQCGKLMAAC